MNCIFQFHTMAAIAEKRMNLASLQQRDPFITGIVETASQVALYTFKSESQEWDKTDVEGTLFVYSRSAAPVNGFMILNRLGLNDLIEPLNKNLEFQLQDPFLLYKSTAGIIFGIWFFDIEECTKIGQLMNGLVQISLNIPDIVPTEVPLPTPTLSALPIPRNCQSSPEVRTIDKMDSNTLNKNQHNAKGGDGGGGNGRVNILEMLNKAQNEYNQGTKTSPENRHQHVSPRGKKPQNSPRSRKGVNSPRAKNSQKTSHGSHGSHGSGSNRSTPQNAHEAIVRPMPFKPNRDQAEKKPPSKPRTPQPLSVVSALPPSTPGGTQISLATLFQTATVQYSNSSLKHATGPLIIPSLNQGGQNQLPEMLQQMMNPPVTLEEVERDQRRQGPRESMPQPAGEEAPAPPLATGPRRGFQVAQPQQQSVNPAKGGVVPDSPNTILKRTLNIGGRKDAGNGGRPSHPTAVTISNTSSYWSKPSHVVMGTGSAAQSAVSSTTLSTSSGAIGISTQLQRTSISDRLRAPTPSALPTPNLISSAGKPQHSLTTSESPNAAGQQLLRQVSTEASSVLLTPSAFKSSLATDRVEDSPTTHKLGTGMVDSKAHRVSPSHSRRLSHASDSDREVDISALTKQQLQQSLVHLLKHDDAFLTAVHRGYMESLQHSLRHESN